MSRWSEFEGRSRPWLRCLAMLAAWAAPIYLLAQEPAFRHALLPGANRGPAIAALGGLVLVGVLLVAVRRGQIRQRSLFLPALLPILVGTVLSLTTKAPELGQMFDSQLGALLDERALRSGLVVDGFRGGVLLLSVAFTALVSIVHAPGGQPALAVAFGLRASVPLIAVAAVMGWRVIYGADQVVVLLTAMLGVVALAELVTTPGRESALVFGLALAAMVLAAAAGPIDRFLVQTELPAACLAQTSKVVVRYVPALLLAFALVFARRVDREKTFGALSLSLVPPLLVCALSFVFFELARDWARAPGDRWLSSLPAGFEPMESEADEPPKESVDGVLVIGEQALSRGGKAFGSAQELDAPASCDKLVERLALTPRERLVFAADRRVPLARLDCLLGAVTRAARSRRESLDEGSLHTLCTPLEIRFDAREGRVSPAYIQLFGAGCYRGFKDLTVVGPGWSVSTAAESRQHAETEENGVRCPTSAMALAMPRSYPAAEGHARLVCGYAPSAPPEVSAPPSSAPPPESPFELFSVAGAVLAKPEDRSANVAFAAAIRSCYSAPSTRPQHGFEGWLGVSDGAAQPEMWHVTTGIDDESAARCVRGAALDVSRKLAAGKRRGQPLLFTYSVNVGQRVIKLTTTGIKSNAWAPQAIAEQLPVIRACYEPQLRANPGLSGKLTFSLDLDFRHRILAARSQQPPELARVAYCIAPQLQGLDTRPPPEMGDPRSASFNIELDSVWN
ncbi:MAG TPA: hypothetical protein VM686_12995 [Polyangiaceae bacterium]|nr:hypothetical protein [Polyangiaceae bacterium]